MSFDGGVTETKFELGQVLEMSALNCTPATYPVFTSLFGQYHKLPSFANRAIMNGTPFRPIFAVLTSARSSALHLSYSTRTISGECVRSHLTIALSAQ
jgi:hypothetical protein